MILSVCNIIYIIDAKIIILYVFTCTKLLFGLNSMLREISDFIFIVNKLKLSQSKRINEMLQESEIPTTQLNREFPSIFCDVKSVNSRKVMSRICCKRPTGDKTFYDTITSQWLHPSYRNLSSGKRVAIVGEANIGKTLVWKRVLNAVKDRYDFVFHVSLEYVNCFDEMNLLQFLTNQCRDLPWIYDKAEGNLKIVRRVVQKLTENDKTVCIIIDDLEKSNFFRKYFFFSKPYFNTQKAGYFVANILQNWFFPNNQKIFVMNPWLFFQLRLKFSLKMDLICVLGIDHNGQKNIFCNQTLGCNRKGCELGNTCLGFVTDEHEAKTCPVCNRSYRVNCHDEIQSLCYVPENCKRLLKCRDGIQPVSAVSVSASIMIENLLNQFHHYSNLGLERSRESSFHVNSPESLRFREIGQFAWKQYKNNTFVFVEQDLVLLNSKEIDMFFCSRREYFSSTGLCGDLVFSFSHVLLQELFAALWLLSLETSLFQKELNNNDMVLFREECFEVVLEFMINISMHHDPRISKCRNSSIWNIPKSNIKVLGNFLEHEKLSCILQYYLATIHCY